jgi:hypothetical protein
MTAAGRNGPLVPHMRPCAPHRRNVWIGDNRPSKRMQFLGLLRVCMPSKHSDVVAIHHHWNKGALWGPYTHSTSPNITSASSGGYNLFIWSIGAERKASCGALGGHFHRRPWLWRLWCQLCFVIRLLKLSIKTLKLFVCNQFVYELLYIVKHIIIHVSLIVAWTEPELYGGQSPNHFGPMDPGILGIAGKLLSLWVQFSHTKAKM